MMSDGVMTSSKKKHWISERRMSAVDPKRTSKDTVDRQCVEVCAEFTNCEKEGCDKFTGALHAGREYTSPGC